MPTSTRQPSGLTAYAPPVAYSVGGSLNAADDTRDPRRTRPAGHRLTTFAPAIADSVGGSLNAADHALHRGANYPAGRRCLASATRDVASLTGDP
jgi:hypothetical protein